MSTLPDNLIYSPNVRRRAARLFSINKCSRSSTDNKVSFFCSFSGCSTESNRDSSTCQTPACSKFFYVSVFHRFVICVTQQLSEIKLHESFNVVWACYSSYYFIQSNFKRNEQVNVIRLCFPASVRGKSVNDNIMAMKQTHNSNGHVKSVAIK